MIAVAVKRTATELCCTLLEVVMRKLILKWLFGTEDIQVYLDLLRESAAEAKAHLHSMESHLETLHREQEFR